MSSHRQFVPHTRHKFIRPMGMGMSQGFRRAMLPIKATHMNINHVPILGKGVPLLLEEDLGVSDMVGTGSCCASCAKGMSCSKKGGKGFGVPPISQKLVDKLQKLSLKAVDGIKKRKNVGAIF